MNAHIIPGDVRQSLATLPDQSVQTCITSPPYYGLRDYGTAKWEGGDAECDHKANIAPRSSRPLGKFHGGSDVFHETPFRHVCGKCGARRIDHQIGLEESPDAYVAKLVKVFREVRRVLKNDGTVWINLGDSYNAASRKSHGTRIGYKQETNRSSRSGADANRPSDATLKPKDLIGIPWRVAFALQADGWYLRQDIIWAKPNPMPESVRDRCTKAHEYVFLLSKSAKYFYDADAVKEPAADSRGTLRFANANATARNLGKVGSGSNETLLSALQPSRPSSRNRRSVWTVTPKPFKEAHFAVMPEALVEPCILAGSRPGDVVMDPFAGSGTVGAVALRYGRSFVGCELNTEYIEIAQRRMTDALKKAA